MVVKRPRVALLSQLAHALRSWLTRRARLEAENLILRQQLVVLRRKSPRRVRLWNFDRLLLVWLYRLYSALLDAIIIVQPVTVIRWHRRGFRAYWRWKSRHVGGRPRIGAELWTLIRRMNRENPLWGAPRIHDELLMLGIEVAEALARAIVQQIVEDRQPLELTAQALRMDSLDLPLDWEAQRLILEFTRPALSSSVLSSSAFKFKVDCRLAGKS
jgi:hypothetical protein